MYIYSYLIDTKLFINICKRCLKPKYLIKKSREPLKKQSDNFSFVYYKKNLSNTFFQTIFNNKNQIKTCHSNLSLTRK